MTKTSPSGLSALFSLLILPVIVLGLHHADADYALSQLGLVATYAIAGLGLFIITGQAGQITLGHGAFMALGAYTETLLQARGIPFIVSIPAAIVAGGLGGALASLPARRLCGLYFGMSTLAFALLTEEVLTRWDTLTQGAAGISVPPLVTGLEKISPSSESPLAYSLLALIGLLLTFMLCLRCMHAPPGRAWRALQMDETAAQLCAINPVTSKLSAFVLGCGLAGFAGALYAHQIGFISPEQFGLKLSFELLILIYIGGTRHPAGAIWGALILIAIPQGFSLLRDAFPVTFIDNASLEPLFFGTLIVSLVLFRRRTHR